MHAVRTLVSDRPSRSPSQPHLRLVPPAGRLTPTERQAVEIGRDDAYRLGWDAGLARTTWINRLIARLTGIHGATALADQRLEKVRLFAAMMRRDDRRIHAAGPTRCWPMGSARTALHQAIAAGARLIRANLTLPLRGPALPPAASGFRLQPHPTPSAASTAAT
jgi:hypothetical protein